VRRTPPRALRSERGSLAPAVPIIAFALLLLGGLTIDASRQLNARGEAVAFAEEAARAGAQGVDITADDLELDPVLARDRVDAYCRRVLELGSVSDCEFVRIEPVSASDPRPLVVATRVRLAIDTTLLGMVGVRTLSASATARARPYEGIDAPIEP
jgi:Flp pilus assembly protein TadG